MHYFLLFLLRNIDCGYSLEPSRRGGSNEYPQLCFVQKYEKYFRNVKLIFAFDFILAESSVCPIGWDEYGSSCYYFGNGSVTWAEARVNINDPQRQKTYHEHVRTAKIQISLRICAVWS